MASTVKQVGKPQLEGLVEALVDSACDREGVARDAIFKSLVDIGRRRYNIVLEITHRYLAKHNKLGRQHRIILLTLMEKISKEHIDVLSEEMATKLITLGSLELTLTQEVEPEWQGAASTLLSTLGLRHAQQVMKELLNKFQPGSSPHFFVVKTLGQLATSNVVEVVPLLNTVLGRMIPMLGAAKQDNMQWVFAYATSRFCEAILDFLADEKVASEANIRATDFEGEAYSIYELFTTVWLQSKEAKLRLVVAEAIGYTVHLVSTKQLDSQLPRLIPTIQQLYKKHQEHYYISQCLCMVVDAACKKNCESFQTLLDNLLLMLHTYACAPVDVSNPVTIKNNNELLRCFAVVTKSHSNRVIAFLLQKMEVNQEKVRVATLNVIKHLINSCDAELEDKKPLLLSGLNIILQEQNLKVRRMFNQVVIAMASHGYLGLEGGQLMIEFVVCQCSIDVEDKLLAKFASDDATPRSLRDMSCKTLLLITTTIEHMDSVLWPYLLEFVVPVKYTRSLGIVCRCIADFASQKREADTEDYTLDFEELVNLPKPPELLSRLIVMCGNPHDGEGRGEHVLAAMKALSPNLREELVELWDAVIPKLLAYLSEHSPSCGNWDQRHWEDLMLKFLSRSLDDVDNEDWLMEVGNAMADREKLVQTYSNYPHDKGFLYKCIGVILRKSTHKQFVQKHLDTMFATVKHSSQVERDGCAIGTGFCATSHLDTVVLKLEQVAREDMVRKSRGFFGLSKDKTEADVERIKATVMLCYGYVTFHSPPNLITSRVEVNILRSINPHFSKVKDNVVKQNLIRTIDLIGRALHPDHLKNNEFVFSKRADLVNHLLGYIRAEPVNAPVTTETRALAISALATLSKLNPKLSPADQFDIIKVSTDSVYPLPSPSTMPINGNKKKSDSVASVDELEALLEQATTEVTNLLVTLLQKEFSSDNLESIFKHMEHWIQSSDEVERCRAMSSLYQLLKAYQDHSDQNEPSRHLPLQGQILGRMVPRCSDPNLFIRQTSIDCIQITLRIATCMPGVTDQLVEAVSLLRERAEKDEPNSLFSLVNDLSKVLCKKISADNLWQLVVFLLEGLLDFTGHSSSGACVVLNQIMKLRGSALSDHIPDLIDLIHDKLLLISNPQTRTGTLRCMRTLCHQYLSTALTHLLNKTLPWDEQLVAMWQVLVSDEATITQVFQHILEVLSFSLPYQEKQKGGKTVRIETDVPKAASQALAVLCAVPETGDVAKKLYQKLFTALLLRIGVSSTIDNNGKVPTCISVAVEALKQFLLCTESTVMLERLDQQSVWPLLEKEDTCAHGMLFLARALAEEHWDLVQPTVETLGGSLMSVYDHHRITVVAFYSELVCTLAGREDCKSLAEQIMNNMLGRQVDANYMVRMYCIRGLGNMADIGGKQVSTFSTTILSAMLAGMDDREDPQDLITMEAMSGLARIFQQIDEGHVRPILINIALRIRPCFEKPTPAVRAAAFTLFGSLSRFGNGPSEGPFLEQIQTNFVSLLVHLNEADPTVVVACKGALQKLGPLIKSQRINEMFQKHLNPEESLLYPDFLNDLCKLIVVDFTDKVNSYVMNAVMFFKSMWPEVKCNAALFVGFMLGNLPKENAGLISKEHICEALTLLLRDPSPDVRASTAEAMSLLCDY